MEVPKPVDISVLSGILAKSKQVMNKVETTNPVKQISNSITESSYSSSYPSSMYDETDEREVEYNSYQQQQAFNNNVGNYTDEQVMNSNLPPMVKEAMIKNRIPKLMTPPAKFTAEDIAKMTGAPLREAPIKNNVITETRQPSNSDLITVSKSQLQDMIDEGISRFFKQVYNKTLTEETIKKTLNVLLKEGRLTPPKKTK